MDERNFLTIKKPRPNDVGGCGCWVYQAAGITSGWNHKRNIWKAIAWKHIRCHNWYPNVNIRIDPFATLVPKCQYSDRFICNIGTQITKNQYSDRPICNMGSQIPKLPIYVYIHFNNNSISNSNFGPGQP